MEARVLVGLGNLGTSKLLCYAGKWIYTFQLLMVIQGINGAINPQAAAAAAAMNPQAAALYQQRLQAQSTPTSTAPPTPGAPPNLSAFIRPPRPVLILYIYQTYLILNLESLILLNRPLVQRGSIRIC